MQKFYAIRLKTTGELLYFHRQQEWDRCDDHYSLDVAQQDYMDTVYVTISRDEAEEIVRTGGHGGSNIVCYAEDRSDLEIVQLFTQP